MESDGPDKEAEKTAQEEARGGWLGRTYAALADGIRRRLGPSLFGESIVVYHVENPESCRSEREGGRQRLAKPAAPEIISTQEDGRGC